MTLNDFMRQLSDIDELGWSLDEDGRITSADDLCPLHEVWLDTDEGCEEGLLGDWGAEADRLGLAPSVATKIVMAADSKLPEPEIRRRLLAACGLDNQEYAQGR